MDSPGLLAEGGDARDIHERGQVDLAGADRLEEMGIEKIRISIGEESISDHVQRLSQLLILIIKVLMIRFRSIKFRYWLYICYYWQLKISH